MQNTSGKRGWKVALAVAATAAALAACTAANGAALKEVVTQPAPSPSATTLTSAQLRSVLVPLSSQPPSQSNGPITVAQAAASNAFAVPAGMVFSPSSCATYALDTVGAAEATDGWVQSGIRNVIGSIKGFWEQQVALLKKLLDLLTVKSAAASCSSGTLTLNGQVTGTVSITERTGPQFSGASTLYLTQTVQFPPAQSLTTAQQNTLAQFGFPAGEPIVMHTDFVLVGRVLLVASEGDASTADSLVGQMYQNLQNQ